MSTNDSDGAMASSDGMMSHISILKSLFLVKLLLLLVNWMSPHGQYGDFLCFMSVSFSFFFYAGVLDHSETRMTRKCPQAVDINIAVG